MSNLFPTYARWEVEPKWAKGTKLVSIDGTEYLDFTSGIGVCNLGHRPDAVYEKVKQQMDQFWHVSNLFPVSIQEEAAKLLAENAKLDYVFFANSGAEANEGAIKLARKATGRGKVITFIQSFHGRTFATMAATGQDKVKTGFGKMLETFVHVPFNDSKALELEMGDDVAAVMLEVIQGEGGVHLVDKEFLRNVDNLCKKHGALLIIDEIQTGIGRTGKPFAYEHFDMQPDIITAAKGLGSGFPIGAIIGKASLKEVFDAGSHGSTFGGNPLAISAAIATMETIFSPSFLQQVKEKGEYLLSSLRKQIEEQVTVEDVRGIGLMIGIQLSTEVAPILKTLREKGVLLLQAGPNVIRLLPPLTVTYEEIDKVVHLISETLEQVK